MSGSWGLADLLPSEHPAALRGLLRAQGRAHRRAAPARGSKVWVVAESSRQPPPRAGLQLLPDHPRRCYGIGVSPRVFGVQEAGRAFEKSIDASNRGDGPASGFDRATAQQ